MLTALPVIVGSECVTGVIAPMTPNGACSMTARPWSPLKTSLRMNSTPGVRSPSVLSFSILCSSRPILVSSISIVPSSTHWSIEMRRMWSMIRLRSSIVRSLSCSNASVGGGDGFVDVGEHAVAAADSRGRWPLRCHRSRAHLARALARRRCGSVLRWLAWIDFVLMRRMMAASLGR